MSSFSNYSPNKKIYPWESEAICQLISSPQNFTTASGKLLPQEPTPTPPSLTAVPSIISCSVPSRSLECCPWNDAQTPLLRAQRWNESSFMGLLLTGLNYNPLTFTDQSQEVFFSSHTACLEGLRWLITAKSLEKGEKEGLTFNSAPGSL